MSCEVPRVLAMLEPGLQSANAFGVNFKLRHYHKSLSLDAYQWG